MEQARVVVLGNNTGSSNAPRVATFEEAFGEYSELFGKKARKRRATRKASRVADRKEKRTLRRTARNENKAEKVAMRDERKRNKVDTRQARRSDRKQNRQQMRIGRRAERKRSRQAMRGEQQAARMERRMNRKVQRQDRKDVKAQREQDRELMAMQMQDNLDQQYPEDNYDDGGYDDQGYADEYDDQGYDDGGYDDGGYADEYDDGGYADEGYADEGYGEYDTAGGGSYDQGYDDEYGYADEPEYYDYDMDYSYEGFDDVMDADEYEDFEGNIEGTDVILVKNLDDVADKIEWNKEYLDRLIANPQAQGVEQEIANKKGRIIELKIQMNDFIEFGGDYSDASGGSRRPNRGQIMSRMRLASRSKRNAQGKRKRAMMSKRRANPNMGRGNMGRGMMKGRATRQDMISRNVIGTPVAKSLNPSIQNQRIEIPSNSNFNAVGQSYNNSGILGLDEIDDIGGAPTTITLGKDSGAIDVNVSDDSEVMSNMTGLPLTTSIPYKEIGLGLAVGVAAVLILKNTIK